MDAEWIPVCVRGVRSGMSAMKPSARVQSGPRVVGDGVHSAASARAGGILRWVRARGCCVVRCGRVRADGLQLVATGGRDQLEPICPANAAMALWRRLTGARLVRHTKVGYCGRLLGRIGVLGVVHASGPVVLGGPWPLWARLETPWPQSVLRRTQASRCWWTRSQRWGLGVSLGRRVAPSTLVRAQIWRSTASHGVLRPPALLMSA